jgi:hypothetical protein
MKFKLIFIYIFFQSIVSYAQINNYQLLKQQFNYQEEFIFEKIQLPNINIFSPIKKTVIAHKQVPKAYNYDDLAFFCKLEVKIENVTKVPIKFRLGDFQYIEKLEGKPYSPFLIDP